MKTKTILIIVLTALVTIILMKNADEVEFWIFGTYNIPKLAVLGVMFLIGVLVGVMIRRKKPDRIVEDIEEEETHMDPSSDLSDQDKKYIQ